MSSFGSLFIVFFCLFVFFLRVSTLLLCVFLNFIFLDFLITTYFFLSFAFTFFQPFSCKLIISLVELLVSWIAYLAAWSNKVWLHWLTSDKWPCSSNTFVSKDYFLIKKRIHSLIIIHLVIVMFPHLFKSQFLINTYTEKWALSSDGQLILFNLKHYSGFTVNVLYGLSTRFPLFKRRGIHSCTNTWNVNERQSRRGK